MQVRVGRGQKRVLSCIFCGSGGLTGEHVFPRWARAYFDQFPRKRASISVGLVYPDRTNSAEWLLKGALRDWKVRCVCGRLRTDCNTGWMKDIEDATKPILLPMIQGLSQRRLSPEDLNVIATWAVLKVMVTDRMDDGAWAVHHTQRRYMYQHHRPPERSWAVWLGRYQRQNWQGEWISRPFFALPEGAPREKLGRPVSHSNSNSVTQVIGEVFIHVLHTVNQRLIKDWRFSAPQHSMLSGPFFKIWPPVTTSILWPPRSLSDGDADFISQALSRLLNRNTAEILSRPVSESP